MARRNEGASPSGAVTEAQRSQRAFCGKTLWAAVLLPAIFVGSALKARCGDSRPSPPRLRPKSLAAEPLVFLKHALERRTARAIACPVTTPNQSLFFPLRQGVFARRIGVVTAGRLQCGPRAAKASKSRIWATLRLHTS
jgi:hypothetical protein